MRKFRLTTAAALLALASAAAPMSADAAVPASCVGWNTTNFHKSEWPTRIAQCLRAGMDPNIDIIFGNRPLHVAADRRSGPEIIRLLLKHGAEPNAANSDGNTPLHVAAKSIDYVARESRIAALLKGGADPNRKNNAAHGGNTPLHLAAIIDTGAREGADALLKGGADPNMVNNKGLTPLHSFAMMRRNYPEIITRLIRGGADPNLQTPAQGDTALHLAISGGSPLIPNVEALLAGGADPCILNAKGFAPYHLASIGSDLRANILFSAGGRDDACEKREGRPTVRGPGSGVAPVPAEVARNKCEGKEKGAVCWTEIDNRPGCYLLDNNNLADQNETVTWSGTCRGGVAEGEGTLVLTREGKSDSYTGSMNAGKPHGRVVIRFANGYVEEGPYENGKRHGLWVFRSSTSTESKGFYVKGYYVNDKEHGRWLTRYSDGNVFEDIYENGKILVKEREVQRSAWHSALMPTTSSNKKDQSASAPASGTVAIGRKCSDGPASTVLSYCWTEINNLPGCYFGGKDTRDSDLIRITWSGSCRGGVAEGEGTLHYTYTQENGTKRVEKGSFRRGKRHGRWVFRDPHSNREFIDYGTK